MIVSLHGGPSWGISRAAWPGPLRSWLIDSSTDIIHGHSSHHPRPLEVYRGKLVLNGCGDLIDDYESITGYQAYRADCGCCTSRR